MKFTEAQLESAIIELLGVEGYPHVLGEAIERQPQEVLIKADLRAFLAKQYAADHITQHEIEAVIKQLEAYSAADLYESNKAIMKLVSDGFLLKREDRSQKDLYIQLIDYSAHVKFRDPKSGEVPTHGCDFISQPLVSRQPTVTHMAWSIHGRCGGKAVE